MSNIEEKEIIDVDESRDESSRAPSMKQCYRFRKIPRRKEIDEKCSYKETTQEEN